MSDLTDLTVTGAHERLARGETTSVELTRACLERIEATDEHVGAFLAVCADKALADATAADARRAAGESGALLGVPIGVKDVILTRGVETTAGSKILSGFVGPYDATVTERLRDAGAVILGKLNCDEFAMGSSTENSGYKVTRNPWDPTRTPGGSSGGSAAAVAAAQCPVSLGTDTGGSIRQPAAHCGVVGLKPSYGRVSRYGVIAYASSLDQVGPMGRTVADCAHVLQAIAGHDRHDSTSVPVPVPDYAAGLAAPVDGLRMAIPREYFVAGMQPAVEQAVHAAIDGLASLGMQRTEISLPHTEYAMATYYLIATAEASSNLARYDGVKYGLREDAGTGLLDMYRETREAGFGTEVKRRIMLGTYALSAGYYDAYYVKAQKVRTLIRQDFEAAFADADVIVTPISPTTAFGLGEKVADPLQMYLTDVFTIAVNLAGLPAISVPCGFDEAGLPIGLQIIGKPFAEDRVLQVAHAYEQIHSWSERRAEVRG